MGRKYSKSGAIFPPFTVMMVIDNQDPTHGKGAMHERALYLRNVSLELALSRLNRRRRATRNAMFISTPLGVPNAKPQTLNPIV